MTSTTTEDDLNLAIDKALPDIRAAYVEAGDAWQPHDYIPWDDGRNYAFLGGEDFDPADVKVHPVVAHGLVLGLLTKDHLPSFHRLLAQHHLIDSDWGKFVGHWTAEENRHAISLRDHVVVSRTFDVEQLEAWRLEAVTRGYRQYEGTRDELHVAEQIAMVMTHEVLSADYFDRLADFAEKTDGTPAGLVTTLRKIAHDDRVQLQYWTELFAVALDVNEGHAKDALLGQARAVSAIGAETAEGLDESRRIVVEAEIGTPERDRELISGLLERWALAL
ncbi:acyl-ACP desaturase [Tsukamurella paurometabola]|uniref:Putative fatty acid desaturase n=1 Tax=Tsukamurella paurometabola (strain ATCC 8368 / DSM 20162 / CCUG 35730 / CIP 100753 / JCM 10117 / KCTC 9821 / NBRC 16120 / NCIMB 702349 / NCTC 13040) TaxID=521096 RepID=D5UUZ8_TSUPD|nr:acyl-ACP desaturase [Tsukamurella paurometabola]ADG79716.1 putative fatty acid desaturase [Tsukamurella paurometabola DSM 20162]SUP36906.1 Putative acyl-[acyl-carrier-protein] desaturase desA1 [Tsukamurella paurometabola]